MSKDFVVTTLGLSMGDGKARLIYTDAAPGASGLTSSTATGAIAIGSTGSAVEGKVYIKKTTGSGTDKWDELLDATALSAALDDIPLLYDPKDSVRVATAAALPANTQAGSGVGATLTMDAVGIVTIDGEDITAANSWSVGDRILVKDEVDQTHNGIYTVDTLSDAGTALVLVRATDFDGDPAGEVSKGAECFVEEGTANENTNWRVTSPVGNATVDTDNIVFSLGNRIGSLAALQTEINNIETSLGGAVNSDGTFAGFTGTNHIDAATSFTNAITLLDTEIGADLTANARANNPVIAGNPVNSNIEALDDAIGLDAQITPLTRTLGSINLAQSIYTNLGNIDSFLGQDSELTPLARTAGPVSLSSSVLANIDALDAAIGGNPSPQARTFNAISAAQATNFNIDTLDAAIGSDLTSTNIVSNAQSVNDNISALDGQVQNNTDKLAAIRTVTQTNAVTTSTTVATSLVDDCRMMQYKIVVEEAANPDKRESFIVTAMHNGTASADATDVDFDDLHRLSFSSNKVAGLDYDVVLSGVGAAQEMQLKVVSTNSTNVTVYAECMA